MKLPVGRLIAQDIREGNGLRSHLVKAPHFVNVLMGPESLGDLSMAIPPVSGRARTVHNSVLFTSKLPSCFSMPLYVYMWLAHQQR